MKNQLILYAMLPLLVMVITNYASEAPSIKHDQNLSVPGFSIVPEAPQQTPWTVLNVKGYSMDSATGKVDDTEGFGAFDDIIEIFKPHCPHNFDNGGGAFDANSEYLKQKYNINNVVYDPYMRSKEHNQKIVAMAMQNPFDCCTSISVLNVIDTKEARLAHIRLCYDVIKNNSLAYFKVWPGNGTGISVKEEGRYQSNQNALYYVDEIRQIFGQNNVIVQNERTIKAQKTI